MLNILFDFFKELRRAAFIRSVKDEVETMKMEMISFLFPGAGQLHEQ